MIESRNNLSPAGQLRREEILKRVIGEATHRRYSRIERRLGALLIAVICLAGTLIVRHRPIARERSFEIAGIVTERPKTREPMVAATERIQIVRTDPNIIDRLRIQPQPPRWTVIGDDELLATLQAAGRPAGLIEIDGKARILFR